MTINITASSDPAAAFAAEDLPFPPLPPHLAAALQPRGSGWFATRPVDSSPYDLGHFVDELAAQPAVADYAVIGFDGHGINSWAMHHYLVTASLALFVQLPWGGAYGEPALEREDITSLLGWAAKLQPLVDRAQAAGRIPQGMRLQVIASRFGRAGWRWAGGARDPATTPWKPAAGMLEATLAEVGGVIEGRVRL